MTTPSDNNNTSYRPFAKSNYVDVDNNKINTLSAIDEESIKITALLQLKEKLSNVPHATKSTLVYAQAVTDIVNDDHFLCFLYVENYNVDLALTRLLRYWNSRYKVFGDDYILPLTLYGAMKDKVDVLKKGILVLLPEPDDRGRAIIYFNFSLMGVSDPDKVIQVWWYLIHVAMERPSCRKNGFVVLFNGQDVRLRHVNTKVWLAIIKTAESTFPVRRQEGHMCNPTILPLIASAMKAMLSLSQRQTITVHSGTSNRVLESLAACSLPSSVIPANMGGSLHLSLEELVAARLAKEGQADNIITSEVNHRTSHAMKAMLSLSQRQTITVHNGTSNRVLESLAACSLPSSVIPANMGGSLHLSLEELVAARLAKEGQADNMIMSEVNRNKTSHGDLSDVSSMISDSKPSFIPPPKSSSTSTHLTTCLEPRDISEFSMVTDQQSESTTEPTSSKKSSVSASLDLKPRSLPQKSSSKHAIKVEEKGKFKIKKHPGRCGDERMNKAVDAKRRNPVMSLQDAVLAGGFIFPSMNAPGVKVSEAKDLDGVSFYQRKNQLNRRLRLARNRKTK